MKPSVRVSFLVRDGDIHHTPVWWWKYKHDRELTPSNFSYVMDVFLTAKKSHDKTIFSSMRVRR